MILTGQKVNIREIKLSDEYLIYKLIFNDKRVLEFFLAVFYEDEERYKPTFNRLLEKSKEKDYFICAITDKNNNLMGIILEQSHTGDTIELGYCLGSEYWNKGYMTQALMLAVVYISQNTHYNNVICAYLSENTASRKVLDKCGFELEHVVDQEVFWNGKQHDVVYMKFKIR